jgi:hypothetical protein
MERRGPSWIRSGIAAAGVGKGGQGYQSGGLAGGCRGGGDPSWTTRERVSSGGAWVPSPSGKVFGRDRYDAVCVS